MDIDTMRDLLRESLNAHPVIDSVSEIHEGASDQRVIGTETTDGTLFFVVIQES
ncbi:MULTISPECIES: hypothetical protein [Streptomyces]|uniref:Uncharacterized protein n=1 Tax=Streptomyces eurythermus TaxID=42237 RepID=A0ABW6YTG1_9ACTN|nr:MULTISPECIES: hypothetical protein [Streptomyces]QIS71929.1 hypothetical protein HB370_19640 [Streptomyces sp. DSM 40868]